MKKYILSAIFICFAAIVSAQNRSTFIHMKSGEIKEFEYNDIDSITFGEPLVFDEIMNATETRHIYYGGTSYQLHFSDRPISESGLPTEVGQKVLRLYVFADAADDSNNAFLKAGRYEVGGDIAVGHIYTAAQGYSGLIVATGYNDEGKIDGYQIELSEGTGGLNVEYEGDGTAKILFKSDFVDYGDEFDLPERIMMTYSGAMVFDNQDPASYKPLTQDITMIPIGLSGGYSNVEGMYGSYDLTYYNCELDENGFVVGAGELLNISLLTPESAAMDISLLEGEYTPTSASVGPWNPGNFMLGEMFDFYGMSFPIGCYYMTYDENGEETSTKGFVTGGTIKVTLNNDKTQINLVADFTAEGGKKITMDYTAPVSSIIDRATMSAPAKTQKSNGLRPARQTNIHNLKNTLPFVRK